MKIVKKQAFTVLMPLLLTLALGIGNEALSQERKAYRHVDAAGKITYSQTPPVDGKEAKAVSTAPAQQGRGGDTSGYSPYDDPRYYSNQNSYNPYAAAGQTRQSQQQQRLAAVKAECLRQRGTDCNNPATLQYLDSTSIPRRGRY
jgi:hypothetical protein